MSIDKVLLVGAGASKPFGYPVCRDFFGLDRLKEVVGMKEFQQLATAVGAGSDVGKMDVELILDVTALLAGLEPGGSSSSPGTAYVSSVLSNLATRLQDFAARLTNQAANRKPNPDFAPLCQGLSDQLRVFRTEMLTMYGDLNRKVREAVIDVYGKRAKAECREHYGLLLSAIIGESGAVRLPVFTTNYDNVLEEALLGLPDLHEGILMYDGFTKGHVSSWHADSYGPFFDEKAAPQPEIALFKLHGSVDWAWEDMGWESALVRGTGRRMHDLNDHALLFPAFKGVPTDEVFRYNHRQFRASLLSAKLCVVIGYTFRDWYINSLLSDAMSFNEHLRVCIVEPNKDAYDETVNRLSLDGVPALRVFGLQAAFATPDGNGAIVEALAGVPWDGLRTPVRPTTPPDGTSSPLESV